MSEEAGLVRNLVVSPGELLTEQRSKPCLPELISFTVSVKEDQMTLRQLLPNLAAAEQTAHRGLQSLWVLPTRHLLVPWGTHPSLTPCGPLGAVTPGGTSQVGPLQRLPFQRDPSFQIPRLCCIRQK